MRYNIAPNDTFMEGSLYGWAATNGATIAYTTDYGFYGEGALVVTKANNNASGVVMNAPLSVLPHKSYAFSMYARLPLSIPESHPTMLAMTVTWSNSFGGTVGTNTSGVLEMTEDSTWYRISGVWVAPTGATVATIRLYQPLAGAAGQKFILDALLVEQASFVGGYFHNFTDAEKNKVVQKALTPMPQMINGLRLGADVSINDLTLNTIDEYGTIWICEDIRGWSGQTTPDMPDIGRGTGDGSYDVEGRLTARQVVVTGSFIPADTEQALTAATDRLVEAIDLVRKGGWLRTHSEPTRAAWVRLAGAPTITVINDRGRTRFSVALRAPDPVKYHWDDGDPEGYTRFTLEALDASGVVNNIGNAGVSAEFTIIGPAGPGTRIFNSLTDETITLAEPLRGPSVVGDVIKMSSYDGIATLTTADYNGLRAGDEVKLLGLPVPFTTPGQIYTVKSSSEVFPYSFSFDVGSDDILEVSVSGQVSLVNSDVLVIDTYDKRVVYNGEGTGHRYRLVTLTDWLQFGPGPNPVEFEDVALQIDVASKAMSGVTATIVTDELHYFVPGDTIDMNLNEVALLDQKKLTGNVVTMTTEEPHGFAVGDRVDVVSTESSDISYKARTGNVVTITTLDEHGISDGDIVNVKLPATVKPMQKQLTANVATISTQVNHGFSIGDQITVALPTNVNLSHKGLSGNVATLTTVGNHGYAAGDTVVVTMPASATVDGKQRSGALAYIHTVAPHGFSIGDEVVISLPTAQTPTGTRSIDGTTNLVTLNTSAAHGFSPGDKITVVVGTPASDTITSRSATSTHCTIAIGSHNWTVGEKISVTGVTTRYNGVQYITSVGPGSVTYYSPGAVEATTASGGSVLNVTINSYYNGSKVIETTPTATSLTYRAWDQRIDTSSTHFLGATVTNQTNAAFNGTKTLVTTSTNAFAYNY